MVIENMVESKEGKCPEGTCPLPKGEKPGYSFVGEYRAFKEPPMVLVPESIFELQRCKALIKAISECLDFNDQSDLIQVWTKELSERVEEIYK